MSNTNWVEIVLLGLGLLLFGVTVFEQIRSYKRKKRRDEIARKRGEWFAG